jgi:hypothetical protein
MKKYLVIAGVLALLGSLAAPAMSFAQCAGGSCARPARVTHYVYPAPAPTYYYYVQPAPAPVTYYYVSPAPVAPVVAPVAAVPAPVPAPVPPVPSKVNPAPVHPTPQSEVPSVHPVHPDHHKPLPEPAPKAHHDSYHWVHKGKGTWVLVKDHN